MRLEKSKATATDAMKYRVAFEAIVSPGTPFLLELFSGLQQLQLLPECLVWTVFSQGREARLWMIIETDFSGLKALWEHFRPHPEVRRIQSTESKASTSA